VSVTLAVVEWNSTMSPASGRERAILRQAKTQASEGLSALQSSDISYLKESQMLEIQFSNKGEILDMT
jgi:hypothetical protein